MAKVIKIGLNTKDLNRAIKEIEKYKEDMVKKLDTFRKRLADELANDAQLGFDSALMDDLLKGGMRRPDVTVLPPEDNGNVTVVIAKGKDAVFVEFGAGVYHNGSVGSSPNPLGAELGYTIGSYGKGYGKREVWGYYTNPNGKTKEEKGLVLTRGTPASMPMYNAMKSVIAKANTIAREVWK